MPTSTRRVLVAVAGAALLLAACSTTGPTHYQHCAVPMPHGPARAAETDACDEDDDDHNPDARPFYVPADQRHDVVSDLAPGADIPRGYGSFARPTGDDVNVYVVADD